MYIFDILAGYSDWLYTHSGPVGNNNVTCSFFSSLCSPPLRKASKCAGRATNLRFPSIISFHSVSCKLSEYPEMESHSSHQAVRSALTPPSLLNSSGAWLTTHRTHSWHPKPAQSLDHTSLSIFVYLPPPSLFHFCLKSLALSPFPLWCYFHSLFALFSPCLFASTIPASSSLCVSFSLTCLLTRVPRCGFKSKFSAVLLAAGPSSKSQWDNDSRALPISLTWLAGQHSRSPERESRIHKHLKDFASLSVCLSLSHSHSLTHPESGQFNDPLTDWMLIGPFHFIQPLTLRLSAFKESRYGQPPTYELWPLWIYVYDAPRPKAHPAHTWVRAHQCIQVLIVAIQLCNSAAILLKAQVLNSVLWCVYI